MTIKAYVGCTACSSTELQAFEITKNVLTSSEDGFVVEESIGIGMGIQCTVCEEYLHGSHYFNGKERIIEPIIDQW